MKLLAFLVFSVLATSTFLNQANAFTQNETFLCELSGVNITVQNSLLPNGTRFLSASSAVLGTMKEIDCAVAAQEFKVAGIGDTCFITQDASFLFNFYGKLNATRMGLLIKTDNKGLDVCAKDLSLSNQ